MNTTPTRADTRQIPARRALEFLDAYRMEHATTLKVLRAFPPEQSEFRPHPRSSTARQLAWTFVLEESAMLAVLKGEFTPRAGGFPTAPESWQAVLDALESRHAPIVMMLESIPDDALLEPVQFFTGPRQVGDLPKLQVIRFMLADQVHHRGQLSVYLRMVGGQVPSIYGPTADEPWT